MSYEVKLDVFEGPIGLLLTLITSQSIDVYQISLNELIGGFLSEIEAHKALDLEAATEFLLVAATLLEIKCRRLFPDGSELDDDEELAFFEERDLLLARLLECKTYRDVSFVLAQLLENGSRRQARSAGFAGELATLVPDPLAKIELVDLMDSYRRVLLRQDETAMPEVHITALPRISVEQARSSILDFLENRRIATFDDIIADAKSRIDVVVHFLGILELYKLGTISLAQVGSSEPISLERL